MINFNFIGHLNLAAVLVAAIAAWAFGGFWFMLLFGKLFPAGLEEMKSKVDGYSSAQRGTKMFLGFIGNFVIAIGVGWLIHSAGSHSALAGAKVGLAAGLCGGTLFCIFHNWSGSNMKMIFADLFHSLIALAITGAVIAGW